MAVTKPKPATGGRSTLDQQVELVRAMYYSDPGCGKTTALARMAMLGKTIHIDAEKRLKSTALRRLGIPVENIEPFTDISYDALLQLAIDLKDRIDGGEQIVGVCWDSANETARVLVQKLVDQGVLSAAAAGKEKNPWSTAIGDYGDMTEQMRRLLRRFRDLPIHLAVACHAERTTDEEGAVRVQPALTPAVYRDFMGYMDVVIHMRVELVENKEEYSGLTKPIGRWVAKDAFGVFPRVLVEPGFDRVLAYVNGTLDAKTDPVQLAAAAARKRMADTINAKSSDADAPASAPA